jgi:hypothetical protein
MVRFWKICMAKNYRYVRKDHEDSIALTCQRNTKEKRGDAEKSESGVVTVEDDFL